LDLETFQELITPSGQLVLQAASELEPREVDFLRHFQNLSGSYPRELARAALGIAILRQEAKDKFPFADKMYFSRPALEQATPYEVSAYRSKRFRSFDYLADLACSIGGDTVSLASMAPTIGIDLDALRLAMARENIRAVGKADRVLFLEADLNVSLPLAYMPSRLALFFDPARRTGGRRVFSVNDYTPPLSSIDGWLSRFKAMGVKISPGVKLEEVHGYDAEVEFISLGGDLKEAVLWFGPLQSSARRATVLPGPHTLTPIDDITGRRWSDLEIEQIIPISEPQNYLYEPDPAVIRAGLVEDLGVELQASQLDADIAYLTAERLTPTPFARAWAVDDWFPFQLKRLRAYLRDRSVGHAVVKKRGSPIQPEDLIRDLRLEGDQERVIFLTHLKGRPIVIICSP
jgi:hypothetical protein